MRGRGPAALRAVIACAALAAAGPVRAQLALPTGFADDLVVGGLAQPVGMAFLPDGRLLFTERATARIRLIVNGALAANDPVGTVANVRTSGSEQGLLGIAVDPGWPGRPYVYVHYDYAGSATIRISRFTVAGDLAFAGDGSLSIDPATRYDLLTDIPDNASNHNGGTLRFGPDGMLYVSLGDDATSCLAQNLAALAGKILRLDVASLPAGPGGPPPKALLTPADNPYVGHASENARLVAYWGLRNPFRFGIDPATGSLVIGDVGQSTQEELDHVSAPGANLQWPIYEGEVPGPVSCAGVDSSTFTDPIYVYGRSEGRSVMGGAVYRRPPAGTSRFPIEYEGDIFFSDFYSPWVRRLKLTGGAWGPAPAPGQPNATDWATGSRWISDWLVAPDGALWYCCMLTGGGAGPGEIRRIRSTGLLSVPRDRAPRVELAAPYPSPAGGPVRFDYALATAVEVEIAIHDLLGRRVARVLGPEPQGPGPQRAVWDGRSAAGRPVSAGIYVVVLTAGDVRLERRFALLR